MMDVPYSEYLTVSTLFLMNAPEGVLSGSTTAGISSDAANGQERGTSARQTLFQERQEKVLSELRRQGFNIQRVRGNVFQLLNDGEELWRFQLLPQKQVLDAHGCCVIDDKKYIAAYTPSGIRHLGWSRARMETLLPDRSVQPQWYTDNVRVESIVWQRGDLRGGNRELFDYRVLIETLEAAERSERSAKPVVHNSVTRHQLDKNGQCIINETQRIALSEEGITFLGYKTAAGICAMIKSKADDAWKAAHIIRDYVLSHDGTPSRRDLYDLKALQELLAQRQKRSSRTDQEGTLTHSQLQSATNCAKPDESICLDENGCCDIDGEKYIAARSAEGLAFLGKIWITVDKHLSLHEGDQAWKEANHLLRRTKSENGRSKERDLYLLSTLQALFSEVKRGGKRTYTKRPVSAQTVRDIQQPKEPMSWPIPIPKETPPVVPAAAEQTEESALVGVEPDEDTDHTREVVNAVRKKLDTVIIPASSEFITVAEFLARYGKKFLVGHGTMRAVVQNRIKGKQQDWAETNTQTGADGIRRFHESALLQDVLAHQERMMRRLEEQKRRSQRQEFTKKTTAGTDKAPTVSKTPQKLPEVTLSEDGTTCINERIFVDVERARLWLPFGGHTPEWIAEQYQTWETKRQRPGYTANWTKTVLVKVGESTEERLVYDFMSLLQTAPWQTHGGLTQFRGDAWLPLSDQKGTDRAMAELLQSQSAAWKLYNNVSGNYHGKSSVHFVRARAHRVVQRARELIGETIPTQLNIDGEQWVRHDTVDATLLEKVRSQEVAWTGQNTVTYRPKVKDDSQAVFIRESALKSL